MVPQLGGSVREAERGLGTGRDLPILHIFTPTDRLVNFKRMAFNFSLKVIYRGKIILTLFVTWAIDTGPVFSNAVIDKTSTAIFIIGGINIFFFYFDRNGAFRLFFKVFEYLFCNVIICGCC